ncbi:uncharacterized protein LOC108847686 [Raphanus sativus]|uniref:Uncharacterized protein LOC108847686 n=1 Tax=Raphanus sativus TaxID=3726 RepID=A0A9W3DD73_RAPSA|nr:uncharacterized protein LOC108847686 [Raphanus sativus]
MLKIQRLLLYSVEDIIMAALHGLGFQVAATGGGNVSAKISICCLRKDTLFDEHFTRIINPKEHQSFRICSHGNVARFCYLCLQVMSFCFLRTQLLAEVGFGCFERGSSVSAF